MTTVNVHITGMVLFVSPSAYAENGGSRVNAAVAVNARYFPNSTYHIDIPSHEAVVTVPTASITQRIDDYRRTVDTNDGTVVRLLGDRVQFGTYHENGDFEPLSPAGLQIRPSFNDIPRLDEIVDNARLGENRHPVDDEYDNIDSKFVAGWLNIPRGSICARHSANRTEDEVEFRPSRKHAVMAERVEWALLANVNAVKITPFAGNGEVTLIFDPHASVHVKYANDDVQSTGENVTGIGYDFEVLYALLHDRIDVPPLPYSTQAPGSKRTVSVYMSEDTVKATTGVNCGPGTLAPKT